MLWRFLEPSPLRTNLCKKPHCKCSVMQARRSVVNVHIWGENSRITQWSVGWSLGKDELHYWQHNLQAWAIGSTLGSTSCCDTDGRACDRDREDYLLEWFHYSSAPNYKVFVGNDVSEIHTIVSDLGSALGVGKVYWRYVPTENNPTDDVTQGLHPDQLNVSRPYYGGPEILLNPVKLWLEIKVEAPKEEVDKSERKLKWAAVSQETELILGWRKYSSLTKLRRIDVYVRWFANNMQVKEEVCMTGPLTVLELRSAKNYLVKKAQAESFTEEMQHLEGDQNIHKQSTLKCFDLTLKNGYPVVRGRLQKAQSIPYYAQHPKFDWFLSRTCRADYQWNASFLPPSAYWASDESN